MFILVALLQPESCNDVFVSQEDNRPSMEAASDAHFAFGYVIVATRPFSMDIISSSKSMLVSFTFKKFACGIESSTLPILVLSNTAVSPVLVYTVTLFWSKLFEVRM